MEDIPNNNLTFISSYKTFDIKWENINTIEDIKNLLKGLDIQVNVHTEKISEHLEELFKKDLLKERI